MRNHRKMIAASAALAVAFLTASCADSKGPLAPASARPQLATFDGSVAKTVAQLTAGGVDIGGQIWACKTGSSGTFSTVAGVVPLPGGYTPGGTGTATTPVSLANDGLCKLVWQATAGQNEFASVTVTETASQAGFHFSSVAFTVVGGGGTIDSPNQRVHVLVNGFHGSVITFTNVANPVQRTRPLFVIGDAEPHGLGVNVNFWGSQWWKNNDMSGQVDNGVASFKGYASASDFDCGGVWSSRPGNSSNPPATIPDDVLIIVTTKVLKNGPNISGDIKEIVLVHHDPGYDDNPGHWGTGPVIQKICSIP